jgi:hypothetical protein
MNVPTYLQGAWALRPTADALYDEVSCARFAVINSRWLTQLDNPRRGLIQLSGLTESTEGRTLMGPWTTTPTGNPTIAEAAAA